MKNNKGFSLVELLVSIAIVAALSIYFYKIINILSIKYNEVEKEKNNIVNETYITRLIYDALDNEWDIFASEANDNITFSKTGETTKIIEISNMTITSNTSIVYSDLQVGENTYTIDIKYGTEDYPINIYYYK